MNLFFFEPLKSIVMIVTPSFALIANAKHILLCSKEQITICTPSLQFAQKVMQNVGKFFEIFCNLPGLLKNKNENFPTF